jgi:hypothetical protein
VSGAAEGLEFLVQRDAIRTLGFLAVTLVPVTYGQLADQAVFSELIDALVTSLVLAAAFGVGARLATALVLGLGLSGKGEFVAALVAGLAAGLTFWVTLWLFWSWAPTVWADEVGPALFPIYLALCLGAGLVTGLSRLRRLEAI